LTDGVALPPYGRSSLGEPQRTVRQEQIIVNITRIASDADAHAAFDTLTRTLDQRLQRRRAFGLLAVSLAAGVLGTTSRSDEAAAKRKRKKRGKKRGQGNTTPQDTPPVVVQTCAAAAECGVDTDGSMCACRQNTANQGICTKINGRFLATGTCGDCQGAEQCIPVVSGGVECILPCRA
jgi:hypothetical protein